MEFFASSYPQHQSEYVSSLNTAQPNKTIEAKPRLGKDEVNILESEFRKNPKPSTLTKKAFAEEMNVDLPRINNWFQNRRAKRKQEKKLKENEEAQINKNSIYSNPSPEEMSHDKSHHSNNNQFVVEELLSVNHSLPSCASYSSELTNVSSTTGNSFQQTRFIVKDENNACHNAYFLQNSLECNQVPDLTSGTPITTGHLDNLSFESSSQIDGSNISTANQQSPGSTSNQISIGSSPHEAYNFSDSSLDSFTSIPQQLLQGNEQIVSLSPKNTLSQAKEEHYHNDYSNSDLSVESTENNFHQNTNECQVIGCNPDFHVETLGPPPGPNNISFRSRPMNIASRRKKVRHRPAALISGNFSCQPLASPRTASHSEGFNLSVKSPVDFPMRKIVSAGGNRAVVSGRVQKSGFDMAQRSPLNIGSFENVGNFMEQNFNNVYNAPPLTSLSSLCSSLPPSTPNDLNYSQSDEAMSATSTGDGNLVFNLNVSNCFLSLDQGNQSLTSSEITQPTPLMQNTMQLWSNDLDYNEKSCLYDTVDEPLYSSLQDTFNFDSQFNEPFILNSSSQPTTPAFNSHYKTWISEYISPHNECSNNTSLYAIDYTFTNTTCDPGKPTQQKTDPKKLQFSHTTSADFTEK